MKVSWRNGLLGLAGVILGAALFIILSSLFSPHMYAGTHLDTPQPAGDFSLLGPGGKEVHLTDFQGKVVLIFFGYTSCPDVCPATMSELAGVLKALGPIADQVQVLMISVDPEQDTPERLAAYLGGFDARILGLSGSLEQITAVAAAYGVYFAKKPYGDQGKYLVDHTAYIYMIDRRGDLQVLYPFGSRAVDLTTDVRYLLKH